MLPPSGVNFRALDSRFHTACSRQSRWMAAVWCSVLHWNVSVTPRRAHSGSACRHSPASHSATSVFSFSKGSSDSSMGALDRLLASRSSE